MWSVTLGEMVSNAIDYAYLPCNSVVIVDNASYNNKQKDHCPSSNSENLICSHSFVKKRSGNVDIPIVQTNFTNYRKKQEVKIIKKK